MSGLKLPAKCWSCQNWAVFEEQGSYDYVVDAAFGVRGTYRLMSCPSCGSPSVFDEGPWGASMSLVRVGLAGETFPDVPDDIAAAAGEAVKALFAGLDRAAQIMARATVEAVCKELGQTRGSLASKIEALHREGKLSSIVFDEVTEIRAAGNDMAHGDFIRSPEPSEAEQTVEWMRNLLQDVYQRPAAARRRRESREAARNADAAPAPSSDA